MEAARQGNANAGHEHDYVSQQDAMERAEQQRAQDRVDEYNRQQDIAQDYRVQASEGNGQVARDQDYLARIGDVTSDVINDTDVIKGYDGTNNTWCNRALDRMLAELGVDHDSILLPEEVNYKDKNGEKSSLQYTRANDMADLASEAAKDPTSGVKEVTAAEAQALANGGAAVIVTYRNYNDSNNDGISDSGHVALVVPDNDPYNSGKGPQIAQAGSKNFDSKDEAYVSDGFKTPWKNGEVNFYVLD